MSPTPALLTPALLQRLGRSRLLGPAGLGSVGVGERRSRAKGVGVEFAEHRPYRAGDDVRHIDRHVYARLGEHHVRQYALYQQLPVTILLDASASMRFGTPAKFDLARAAAAALAYVALASGDRVLAGAYSGERLEWYEPLHGVRRAPALFAWLGEREARHGTDLQRVARLARPRLRRDGLVIVVSDWMTPNLDEALATFRTAGQELVAVQVLAPEEEEPERLGGGAVRMVDLESGHEVELSLDGGTAARYRADLERWTDGVRDAVRGRDGLYLRVRSDEELERVLLRDWRRAGLLA